MTVNSPPVNQILHGDCIEVMKTLPDQSLDLIFADPPYNLQLQKELIRPNRSLVDAVDDAWDQFDSLETYDDFTCAWLSECQRLLKDTGAIWVTGAYHNIFRVGAIMMDLGYWILNSVTWEKTNPMPNFRGTRFTNATETLIWAKRDAIQKKYTFNYEAMKSLNDEKQMRNVWRIPVCVGPERIKIDGKKAHSTQKPEALLYRVILASTHPGDLILDPFFGTGTTGAVAKKLGRRFIGVEREAAYVQIAQARLNSIEETPPDAPQLAVKGRRQLPRVAFGKLLAARFVKPGQILYSKNRHHTAMIRADGKLILKDFVGSIHKTASRLSKSASANGWDFWRYEAEDGQLRSLDRLRQQYRDDFDIR